MSQQWNPQNAPQGGQQQGNGQTRNRPSFVKLFRTFYTNRDSQTVPQVQCVIRGRLQKPNGPQPMANASDPSLQSFFGKMPISGDSQIQYIQNTLGELYGQVPQFPVGSDGTLWADVCVFDREKMHTATNMGKVVEKYGKGCSLCVVGTLSVVDEGQYGLKLKITVSDFFYVPPYPKQGENGGQQQGGYTAPQGGYTAPQSQPPQQQQQGGWPTQAPASAPQQQGGWPSQAPAPTPQQQGGWPTQAPASAPQQGGGYGAPQGQNRGYVAPPMDEKGFTELDDDDGELPF